MPVKVKIDFVSDVVCPWCAIGLSSLQIAMKAVQDEVQVDLHFQPFELHPDMGPEGADIDEYLAAKYNMGAEQLAQSRQTIEERGTAVGFQFRMDRRLRTWNTFDAHRLLHWAGIQGRQLALKQLLLGAYFTDGKNPSDADTLVALCTQAGLDAQLARQVLAQGTYGKEVRAIEQYYQQRGIHSVPAVVINDRHLISGGQPPEVFEQALRHIALRELENAPQGV
jgi:predicted DsbA family dithiol-disulfide isomerase